MRIEASKQKWALILLGLGAVGVGLVLNPPAADSAVGGVRVAAALVLVVGLAIVGLHAAKRYIPGVALDPAQTSMPIRILGCRKLEDGKSLLIVQISRKRYLLGVGRDSIVNLANISGDENDASFDGSGEE